MHATFRLEKFCEFHFARAHLFRHLPDTCAGTKITAPKQTASTTEHVPILAISKTGPASADAGTTASYDVGLSNVGGATAASLSREFGTVQELPRAAADGS